MKEQKIALTKFCTELLWEFGIFLCKTRQNGIFPFAFFGVICIMVFGVSWVFPGWKGSLGIYQWRAEHEWYSKIVGKGSYLHLA